MAYLAKLRRALRDDEVRRGARMPRTMCETEIMLEGMDERDERPARRIARAKRKTGTPGRVAGGSNVPSTKRRTAS